MPFLMKYPITRKYLPNKSRRRPGLKNLGVLFIVDHDTGNPGSSARGNVGWMDSTANLVPLLQVSSAHTFIDDIEIIECVPLDEMAYHVLFGVKTDNALYGHDANRAAIGVELCYGGKINNQKSYEKYVWYNAYLCHIFKLDPKKHITAHYTLDPGRKTDPKLGLASVGRNLQSFIKDVENELEACMQEVKGATKPEVKESVSVSNYLKRGDTGTAVKQLQENLIKAGLELSIDSSYGPATENAVKAFQTANGLTADGSYGPVTKVKLDASIKPKPAVTSTPIEKGDEITLSNLLKFSTNEGKNAILRVLKRFEMKDHALGKVWREKVENGTFTQDDSHEVMWVAVDRGYITGKME
ncbi:N-acetylmuramoyl-L-alanine amidase [Paenisporosarcina macmurdoensis]|uniref:N-acetylmuramoyl-L-alanine amidase n=1 Tax=Paenisporosarcina macmurdoensis TaxID=212659 RepID=A0ABW1L392_9BACL